jgi:diguanylate cyclase (GGDEF)-like protein
MSEIFYSGKLLDVLMQRKYSCCFHYDVSDGRTHFTANFPVGTVFRTEANDPIEGLLTSLTLDEADKPPILRFYQSFEQALTTPGKDEYLETMIHVNTEQLGTALVLAAQYSCGEDGIATSITGYIVSIANFDFNARHKDEAGLKRKAPFPVDLVTYRMENATENFAVVQFDIIRFKLLNEQYGEEVGDAVLENIRANLERVWAREAVTARCGADIFAVFTEYSDTKELESRIAMVRKRLQNFHNIKYTFSVGVYLVKDKSVSLRKMVDCAAIARKEAKNTSANALLYYEDKLTDELHCRHEVESEMQQALETGQFQVYLQPKCCTHNGEIIGAEALVRWVHPEKGIIPPDKFIPIFESNGFIERLDNYIHEEVCKILRKWLDAGMECVPVSVNVSRIYLNNQELPLKLRRLVDIYRIPLHLFQVEITETYENMEAEAIINCFKDCGFTLLMDDFGAGYSSLNTLKNTKFDVIKLDRDFFGNSMMSERGQKIVTHTIAMTNDIGLEIVAEGVETTEQADFLDQNGCKYAQGYLYDKPLPLSDFEKKLFGKDI